MVITRGYSLVLGILLVSAGCSSGRPPPMDTAIADAESVVPLGLPDAQTDSSGESCNDFDDDADGRIDEGCSCEVGDTKPCFPGPADGPGRAICDFGTQVCTTDFEFGEWSACEGAVICADSEERFTYGEMRVAAPVDVIMAVDQSGSMSGEIASVKANVNGFASALLASDIDFRLIMMASRGTGTYQICVSPPLGGLGCADGERYFQIDQNVQSSDALALFQSRIVDLESHMRSPSLRVFIVVTDDNSYVTAPAFDSFLSARTGYGSYVFHGIIGTSACTGTASVGTVYQQLATMTGGSTEAICAPNWGDSFERFATEIIERTLVFPLAGVPYDDVRLFVIDAAGGETEIPPTGWSYDEAQRNIVLHLGFTPEDGSIIVVRYRHAVSE